MSQTLLDKIGEDIIAVIFKSGGVVGTIRARQLKKYDWCAYIVAEDIPTESIDSKYERERFVKKSMSGRRINVVRDYHGHPIFAETRKKLIKKIRREA